MALEFKCCRKEFNSFLCIVCHSIFHASCMEQIEEAKILHDHIVHCSEICRLKDESGKIETDKLLRKLDLCKKEILEKKCQIEKLEYMTNQNAEDFQKVIEELTKEIKEKNSFILRLQKSSKDFEDQVFEEEQRYEAQFAEQHEIINRMNKEVIELNQKNAYIRQQYSTTNEECEKMRLEIRDLTETNQNMLTSIQSLEADNSTFRSEMIRLHQNLASTKSFTDSLGKNEIVINNNLTKDKISFNKKKVILVACSQGRNLSKLLQEQPAGNYVVESMIKPHANNNELIQTALDNAKCLNKNDVIILWPAACSRRFVKDFLIPLKNSQSIVVTQLYQKHSYRNINETIYYNNSDFFKAAYQANLAHNILDCNNIIRESDYHSDGRNINDTGKRLLSSAIAHMIINYNLANRTDYSPCSESMNMTNVR